MNMSCGLSQTAFMNVPLVISLLPGFGSTWRFGLSDSLKESVASNAEAGGLLIEIVLPITLNGAQASTG